MTSGHKICIRLFVLDDDIDTHEIIKEALSDAPSYDMFSNYEEFINAVDKHVHIAIIDHHLSGKISGMEVMKQLLVINRSCYVIIISGMYDAKLVIKYQEEGSRVFIDKNDGNFVGKLESFVNIAYNQIYSFAEFIENQIQDLREMKPPCL